MTARYRRTGASPGACLALWVAGLVSVGEVFGAFFAVTPAGYAGVERSSTRPFA